MKVSSVRTFTDKRDDFNTAFCRWDVAEHLGTNQFVGVSCFQRTNMRAGGAPMPADLSRSFSEPGRFLPSFWRLPDDNSQHSNPRTSIIIRRIAFSPMRDKSSQNRHPFRGDIHSNIEHQSLHQHNMRGARHSRGAQVFSIPGQNRSRISAFNCFIKRGPLMVWGLFQ